MRVGDGSGGGDSGVKAAYVGARVVLLQSVSKTPDRARLTRDAASGVE